MPGRILSVMEINEETQSLEDVSFELLEASNIISKIVTANLSAAVIGHGVSRCAEKISEYVDIAYIVENEALSHFSPVLHLRALEKILSIENPDYILIAHTYKGVDIAARLAARLEAPLTTDCIGLEVDSQTGLLKKKKQIYGGAIVATFVDEGRPQIVTIRPKVWRGNVEPRQIMGKIIKIDLEPSETVSKIKVIGRVKEETVRLDDAEVIIAGGRGLGSPEGFKELEKLKNAFEKRFRKVEIGCSRPPVDKGWASSSRLIGLTGQRVSPMLYIAIGISGATQHVVGMEKSKIIVAINSDKRAPIFAVADIGAIGDYKKILPSFIKKLEELL